MARGRAVAKTREVPSRIVIPDLTGMIVRAAAQRATQVGFSWSLPTRRCRWTCYCSPLGGP